MYEYIPELGLVRLLDTISTSNTLDLEGLLLVTLFWYLRVQKLPDLKLDIVTSLEPLLKIPGGTSWKGDFFID